MMEPRYPGRTDNFRISNSTVETYLTCGLLWQFVQAERHRWSTVAMLVGTATARAAQLDNETKIDIGTGVTLADMVEYAVNEYESESKDSEVPATRYELATGKDDAAAASRAYGEQLSPHIEPTAAEQKIIAVIDDGIELAGTLDTAERDAVRDLKTGRAWTQQRADRSGQLTGYSMLFEAHYDRLPSRVAIDSLHKVRGTWKATTLWSRRDERDRLAYIERVQRAKAGMEAGIALPASEGSWKCSEKWCAFWGRCTARPGA